MTEHIGLLAAAYAFHAGLSRQAAVAAQVRAMEEPSTVRAGEEQHQLPSDPVPPGRQGGRDPAASAPQTSAPAGSRPPPVDPHSLPGPRRLPAELAAQVLSVVDGGPALVRAEAVRLLKAAAPQDPATPALAVVVLGWLEAAEQVLAAGGSAHELQVLLGVACQEGTPD
jgi:hypothetical protein